VVGRIRPSSSCGACMSAMGKALGSFIAVSAYGFEFGVKGCDYNWGQHHEGYCVHDFGVCSVQEEALFYLGGRE